MASHILDWRQMPPDSCRHGAVTIGNFDGLHQGHAALVTEARREARQLGSAAIALTFDPHPITLLRPEQAPPHLTTLTDRMDLLHALGADQVVVLKTTPAMLALTAQEFFTQVIQDRLAVRALVEGVNFGFGHNREGNVEVLRELCRPAGITFKVLPPVQIQGKVVSSSRVRTELINGAVEEAALLLGRPYHLHGEVSTGLRRGRTIGFPTANLTQVATLIPGNGVYAVRVTHKGTIWQGAANIGPNPTFGEQERKIEVHLLDFQGDLYGEVLTVEFVRRLRDTRPFASVTELVDQLNRDIAAVKGS